MSKLITISFACLVVVVAATLSGCPGKLAPTTPQVSPITMSEIAEAVASGVFNATYSSGTMAKYYPKTKNAVALSKIIESYLNPLPKAEAAFSSGYCPTLQSGEDGVIVANASCTIGTNSLLTPNSLEILTWAPCNMSQPFGTWSGGSNISLVSSPGGTQLTCTGFPPFQAGDVITRSFFSPTGRINNFNLDPNYLPNFVPWNPLTQQDLMEPYNNGPVTVLVDTVGATLIPNGTNFLTQGLTPGNYPFLPGYPTIGSNGYAELEPAVGETITYSSPTTSTIFVNGIHIKADVAGFIVWDFTVSSMFHGQAGNGSILTNGGSITSGSLFVQDNLNLVTTQSNFNGVSYTALCGVPTNGNVSTTQVFGPGTYPNETLTFSATCGTATVAPVPSWGTSPFYLFHSF
jgi:hypothetical protein